YAVGSTLAHRIQVDFTPREVFSMPDPIRQAVDQASPRDIDLLVWAKLVIAAATLSQSDLPANARYPLSLYRALGLLWVTSARRPNELVRLRLDCIREDWDPEMRDEDNQPLEKLIRLDAEGKPMQAERGEEASKIAYLHIPSGKNRGPFWLWVPNYVVDAI